MNVVYPQAVSAFERADIDYLADTIRLQLLDGTYTYAAAHTYLSTISGSARVGTAVTLTGKSVVDAECFADGTVVPSVAAGDTVTSLVVYQDTGIEASSRLITYIDRAADTVPLAITTNGGNIALAWPGGRIFRL
jgi:hypothetical protein